MTTSPLRTPIVYNLFPRLVGELSRWPEHARRAAGLGFNWIYLNPFHYPGFSGSLYAVQDYYRLSPLFLPGGWAAAAESASAAAAQPTSAGVGQAADRAAPTTGPDPSQASAAGMQLLARTLGEMKQAGLRVMMDLVVNHTAKDSPLVAAHPTWYRRDELGRVQSPFAVDPDDPRLVTVWGDLAEIDNRGSPERDALWSYWADLVRFYVRLGFDGFRCDAAYKVPAELWSRLCAEARGLDPEVRFFAETLGCRPAEVEALAGAGFDFLFNSGKWWSFDAPWCLEQHEKNRAIAPSIGFPESHDTTRLAADSGGSRLVQQQRYAFAAAFSAGVLMPVGYEYGFRKRLDVVHSSPDDWEQPAFDLSGFVARVNRMKLELPPLDEEGSYAPPSSGLGGCGRVVILEKRSTSGAGSAFILVNTDLDSEQIVPAPALAPGWPRLAQVPAPVSAQTAVAGDENGRDWLLLRPCRDDLPGPLRLPAEIELLPGEVCYLVPAPG